MRSGAPYVIMQNTAAMRATEILTLQHQVKLSIARCIFPLHWPRKEHLGFSIGPLPLHRKLLSLQILHLLQHKPKEGVVHRLRRGMDQQMKGINRWVTLTQ